MALGARTAASNLAASVVFGQSPPAGPQWLSRRAPFEPQALSYDKPLCASLDGFTLHAATRAGAFDSAGREALLRTCCALRLRRSAWSSVPTAWCASPSRRPIPTGRSRWRIQPAVPAVPSGYQRAPTPPAHPPLRGRAGAGEPVEVASRAALAPSRRERKTGQAGSRRELSMAELGGSAFCSTSA